MVAAADGTAEAFDLALLVDHPHGGGEGRTGEAQAPVSPWNTLTKGYRTRKNKRTQTFIVSRRKKK